MIRKFNYKNYFEIKRLLIFAAAISLMIMAGLPLSTLNLLSFEKNSRKISDRLEIPLQSVAEFYGYRLCDKNLYKQTSSSNSELKTAKSALNKFRNSINQDLVKSEKLLKNANSIISHSFISADIAPACIIPVSILANKSLAVDLNYSDLSELNIGTQQIYCSFQNAYVKSSSNNNLYQVTEALHSFSELIKKSNLQRNIRIKIKKAKLELKKNHSAKSKRKISQQIRQYELSAAYLEYLSEDSLLLGDLFDLLCKQHQADYNSESGTKPGNQATTMPSASPTKTTNTIVPVTATFTAQVSITATTSAIPTASTTATAANTTTATKTSTPSRTLTATASPTKTPIASISPTRTYTQTATRTATSISIATRTTTSTASPTKTATATSTPTRTHTATNTATYTSTATQAPSAAATRTATPANKPQDSEPNYSNGAERLISNYTPSRPFVFVNNQDIQIMRSNVLTHKYQWATEVYNLARNECNNVPVLYRAPSTEVHNLVHLATTVGKPMMACSLAYLVDPTNNRAMGDKAVSWLHTYASNNFMPSTNMKGTYLSSAHIAFAATFDMMHGYMSQSHQPKLSTIENWLYNYAKKLTDSTDINQSVVASMGRGYIGYTLGKADLINAAMDGFLALSESSDMPYGFYNDKNSDACAQGMKNYNFTVQPLMYYGIASMRANRLGYHSFNALYHKNSKGKNLIDDNFKTLLRFATPGYHVPFIPINAGRLLYLPGEIGVQHSLYSLTGDRDWGALAKEGYKITNNSHWYSVYWDGLANGRNISSEIKARNSSFYQEVPGLAALTSGPKEGDLTEDSIHVSIMHGKFGMTPHMNLFLYGKGKLLTSAGDYRYNNYPAQSDSIGAGGFRLISNSIDQGCTTSSLPQSNRLLWDIDQDQVKFAAFKSTLARSLAVTDDYIIDLFYDLPAQSSSNTITIDGLGPDSTYATKFGSNTTLTSSYQNLGNNVISVTWPQHMRIHFMPTSETQAKVATYSSLPHQTNLTNQTFNTSFQTELVRRVNLYEQGANSSFSVIEPLGKGSIITNVERFGDSAARNSYNAVKINSSKYTDYYFYKNLMTDSQISSADEFIHSNASSRYGWIRYDLQNNQISAYGEISRFKIRAPLAQTLKINGLSVDFRRDGDFVIYG